MSWKYSNEYCCDFHRNEAKIKEIESQKLNFISDKERLKFIKFLILDSQNINNILQQLRSLIDELENENSL